MQLGERALGRREPARLHLHQRPLFVQLAPERRLDVGYRLDFVPLVFIESKLALVTVGQSRLEARFDSQFFVSFLAISNISRYFLQYLDLAD